MIADYLDIVKSLHGVTVSLIRNVCTDFRINIPQFFFGFSCTIKIFRRKQSSLSFNLPIADTLFVQHWSFLVHGLYLSLDVDVSSLNMSATMLSNPDICWILGPNSSRRTCQRLSLWDSLRVGAYTRCSWSENTFYFMAKENSSELLQTFHYSENSLLRCIVAMMWLD